MRGSKCVDIFKDGALLPAYVDNSDKKHDIFQLHATLQNVVRNTVLHKKLSVQ